MKFFTLIGLVMVLYGQQLFASTDPYYSFKSALINKKWYKAFNIALCHNQWDNVISMMDYNCCKADLMKALDCADKFGNVDVFKDIIALKIADELDVSSLRQIQSMSLVKKNSELMGCIGGKILMRNRAKYKNVRDFEHILRKRSRL